MKSMLSNLATLACATLALACGSSDDEDANGLDPAGMGGSSSGGTRGGGGAGGDPEGPPPLPNNVLSGTNGTMPCDPLLDTGFAGDELCVLPADDGTGAFFHAGPDDYDDPAQIAMFTMDPNGESTEYYVVEANNADTIWFRDQHYRLRPGSHHLIMYTMTADPPALGWVPNDQLDRAGPIGGTQIYAMDFPEGGQVAPEDVNLARPLSAHQRLAFELHYFNATEEPILREAWVNLMHNDIPAEQRVILGAPFLLGLHIDVPPQATQILNYQQTIPVDGAGADQEMRIVSFFGHRHSSTSRFSIWLHRNGSRDLVYEDYDWLDAKEFFYNSVIENPVGDAGSGTAGAVSGQQFVRTGDILEWECQVTNTLDVNLTVGNDVQTKEMCNVFGTLTSTGTVFLIGAPPVTITTL